MKEPLELVEKSGKWAAQFCGFTLGGWWPTKKQAEDFIRNAAPIINARFEIEAEWRARVCSPAADPLGHP